MAEQSEFVTNVLNILTPLGDVRPKRMFGGYGLFLEGSMFALINKNDELYLKADDENKDAFIARGSGTHGKMPYYAAPAETLESWEEMESWANGAVEAARRGKK
ncbi:MAG: TfoX/Sxy family protein [Rhodospirillales bacterium]|jgi:DNA transformation protein|nr:TfoX/Sxy family protein [Rhodospirillales bacterium]MDP6842466.1 TfoX/Sxy family protein [Rhodospirillales bacterium]|tara:strand:+ start:766 stop:1077 length:312 start_codon:yes stop_codon:yes gene_type:complete